MTETAYQYRYRLGRRWPTTTDREGTVLWIMLNPSTADETHDDPTIRRCIRFSKDWHYSGLEVVNLFAARATNPADLARGPLAAVGGWNADDIIDHAIRDAVLVVCAWGVIPRPVRHLHRDRQVLSLIRIHGHPPHVLGLTQAGYPRHPLYMRATTVPQLWTEEMPK